MTRMTQDEIEDEIDDINAARLRTLSSQENIVRDAQSKDWIVGTVIAGLAVNRPDIEYLNQRGVKVSVYFATDTFVLSAWTGTEWKTTTLS